MEKMEKMEKMEMMMDADMGAGEMAEGGQRERRAGSRSSSMRSTKSAKYMRNSQRGKAAPSATAYKNQARMRNQRAAAMRDIESNQTPRGSLKGAQDISYERGKSTQRVEFNDKSKTMRQQVMKSK